MSGKKRSGKKMKKGRKGKIGPNWQKDGWQKDEGGTGNREKLAERLRLLKNLSLSVNLFFCHPFFCHQIWGSHPPGFPSCRGRDAGCPGAPLTDSGVQFARTGLFQSTRSGTRPPVMRSEQVHGQNLS